MEVITIGPKEFTAGESSSDRMSDRGFSPDSYNINLTKERGVLNFAYDSNERGGTELTGNIICAADDMNTTSNEKYFLDDEGAFYTYSAPTFTKRQTATTGNFTTGTCDLLHYRLELFATSTTNVIRLTGANLSTIDSGWWTGLSANNRHPLERIEDEMFIADGNVIYYWNGSSSGVAFTLPTENRVTSLRRHPDGRTLMAFTGVVDNYSHTKPGAGRVYYCNPTIRDWEREIELEAQVEGTRVNEGVIYCTWGKTFGYFDGNGLKPLKRLATSGTTYSHNIVNMEDMIVIRDGLNVLMFGDLGQGNVWWCPFRNTANAFPISCLAYIGDNKLMVAYADGSGAGDLQEVDFDGTGIAGALYTNRYIFPGEAIIRRIVLVHEPSNAASISIYNVHERDNKGNENTVEQITYSLESVDAKQIECEIRARIFQLKLSPSNGTFGFRMIQIFYDLIK